MRLDVITIFPAMFGALTEWGITARALQRELWQLHRWNPRDHARDAYRSIDDRPYGGFDDISALDRAGKLDPLLGL